MGGFCGGIMKKGAAIIAVFLGVPGWADSITSNGVFTSLTASGFSTGQSDRIAGVQGTPFWNNWSSDAGAGGTHDMNIGYMLTDSGGFAGTPSVLGMDSVDQALLGAGGADPSAFTFTATGNNYTTTLLGAYSSMNLGLNGANGTVFGYYTDVAGLISYFPIYGTVGSVTSPQAALPFPNMTIGTNFGFYAKACYNPLDCADNSETFFTNSALNFGILSTVDPAGAAYNHFALFNLTSSPGNDYVIAFKDGPVSTEGLGDFNDIVVEFADPKTLATPEPATLALVGFGLIAAGLARRRGVK